MPKAQHRWRALGAVALAALPAFGAAPARADSIGAFAFLPPFSGPLPTGGTASLDTKGITLQGGEDEPKLRIGGRLQEDFGAAAIAPRGIVPNPRDLDTRRAWFESYLTLPGGGFAGIQYDLNSAAAPIKDAAIAYKGFDRTVLYVGNAKEPFSLEQLIPNNFTLFVERPQLDVFAPARNFGLAGGTHGDRWTFSAGVFGQDANLGVIDDGVAGTARATVEPILNGDEVLHFGLAGSYRTLSRSGPGLSYASLPDDFLFRKALVSTGTVRNAEDVAKVDAEFAYAQGPFRVQAEYAAVSVGVAGGASRTFQAAYAQAAYVFNGAGPAFKLEPINFSEWATFRGVEVPDEKRVSRGGVGVFELGARLDAIDLDSGPVRGGVERNATVGLNWYPERNLRFMADYVHASADPAAGALAGRAARADSFVGRLQVYW